VEFPTNKTDRAPWTLNQVDATSTKGRLPAASTISSHPVSRTFNFITYKPPVSTGHSYPEVAAPSIKHCQEQIKKIIKLLKEAFLRTAASMRELEYPIDALIATLAVVFPRPNAEGGQQQVSISPADITRGSCLYRNAVNDVLLRILPLSMQVDVGGEPFIPVRRSFPFPLDITDHLRLHRL
jgi:hypothetical protein